MAQECSDLFLRNGANTAVWHDKWNTYDFTSAALSAVAMSMYQVKKGGPFTPVKRVGFCETRYEVGIMGETAAESSPSSSLKWTNSIVWASLHRKTFFPDTKSSSTSQHLLSCSLLVDVLSECYNMIAQLSVLRVRTRLRLVLSSLHVFPLFTGDRLQHPPQPH